MLELEVPTAVDVLLLPPLLSISLPMIMMMQESFIVIQSDIYYCSVGNFENRDILVTNHQTGRKRSHTAFSCNTTVPAHRLKLY